jgi:hypothetical protein
MTTIKLHNRVVQENLYTIINLEHQPQMDVKSENNMSLTICLDFETLTIVKYPYNDFKELFDDFQEIKKIKTLLCKQ